MSPTREQAWNLLCEWNASESLRKHALAVEQAMRALARHRGEDEDLWGLAGLLHDLDYERHPDRQEHGRIAADHLRESGYPDEVVHAVLAHNPVHGTTAETTMAKCLVAVDELTGFVVACALIRPNKDIGTLEARSVRKRMKEKRFAAAVDRAEILRGVELIGVDLDEHVDFVIRALRPIAAELGLGCSQGQ